MRLELAACSQPGFDHHISSIFGGPANSGYLTPARRPRLGNLDAQLRLCRRASFSERDKVNSVGFEAPNGVIVELAGDISVTAAVPTHPKRAKGYVAVAESACLALDAEERVADQSHEVEAGVVTPGNEDADACVY
jgi:hypothetical protein